VTVTKWYYPQLQSKIGYNIQMRTIATDAGLLLMGAGVFLLAIFRMPFVIQRDDLLRPSELGGNSSFSKILGYVALGLLAVGTASQLLSPNPM
jgi:hypothetical protein